VGIWLCKLGSSRDVFVKGIGRAGKAYLACMGLIPSTEKKKKKEKYKFSKHRDVYCSKHPGNG
jgi:hypothetical protein